MASSKQCGRCGAEVSFDALWGLCHKCLYEQAAEPPSDKERLGSGGRRFGDYELGEPIGRGGMGVVYRAVHVPLRRTVALKMILDAESESLAARRRFTFEAETAAKLDHPHIVPIFEMGEHEGQLFLSMKLIEGQTLREHIKSGDLCLVPSGNGTSRADV